MNIANKYCDINLSDNVTKAQEGDVGILFCTYIYTNNFKCNEDNYLNT